MSIDSLDLVETERKRREAVWELFRSETVFLVDYLMVLKHVSLFTIFPRPFSQLSHCTALLNFLIKLNLNLGSIFAVVIGDISRHNKIITAVHY